jgi:hypothetical protein
MRHVVEAEIDLCMILVPAGFHLGGSRRLIVQASLSASPAAIPRRQPS